jgi:hypothetical protein
MTQDNARKGNSVLYWIMLVAMFAALIAAALS